MSKFATDNLANNSGRALHTSNKTLERATRTSSTFYTIEDHIIPAARLPWPGARQPFTTRRRENDGLIDNNGSSFTSLIGSSVGYSPAVVNRQCSPLGFLTIIIRVRRPTSRSATKEGKKYTKARSIHIRLIKKSDIAHQLTI